MESLKWQLNTMKTKDFVLNLSELPHILLPVYHIRRQHSHTCAGTVKNHQPMSHESVSSPLIQLLFSSRKIGKNVEVAGFLSHLLSY